MDSFRNRQRHLIYTPGGRKSGYIRERNTVSKRNKRMEFYFYLKIAERGTQVYFGKLFSRDLFHPFLISRIAIIWTFMRPDREKNINNRKYDIPILVVENNSAIFTIITIKILQFMYSVIKCNFFNKDITHILSIFPMLKTKTMQKINF